MLRALGFGASVAQLVEQLTLNQLVQGSNPCRGTKFSRAILVIVTAATVTARTFFQVRRKGNTAQLKRFRNVFLNRML